ncbi:hypothetical protein DFH27DRAFT_604449 [Peziza echinospora]|nr:hypothetical protein DFH27DRAFT_604449 [Peziza echinospora]
MTPESPGLASLEDTNADAQTNVASKTPGLPVHPELYKAVTDPRMQLALGIHPTSINQVDKPIPPRDAIISDCHGNLFSLGNVSASSVLDNALSASSPHEEKRADDQFDKIVTRVHSGQRVNTRPIKKYPNSLGLKELLLGAEDGNTDESNDNSPVTTADSEDKFEDAEESSPLLKSRGGASTEVVHRHFENGSFDSVFHEKKEAFKSSPTTLSGDTPIGSLMLQSFDTTPSTFTGFDKPDEKPTAKPKMMGAVSTKSKEATATRPRETGNNGRNFNQPRTSHRHPPSSQHPSKCFLSSVKDVNGRLRPQQEISGGKLVRVKYNYCAKRSDEFTLVSGDMYLILAIATDVWAVGSRYEDALDYVSFRPEFQPKPSQQENSGDLNIPLPEKTPPRPVRSTTLPMMKFMPLEAMELVHSYEWSFKAYTPTTPTLRLRSTLIVTSVRGLPDRQLLNPPMRTVSRRSDLLYGENRKLIFLGYDRFVADILQKIIEEAKFSMQRIVEEVKVIEESPVNPSPTASQGWCSSSPTDSAWTYTAASSPTSTSGGGTGSRLQSPTALAQSLGTALAAVSAASSPTESAGPAQQDKGQDANSVVGTESLTAEQADTPPSGFDSERIPKLMDSIAEREGKRKHLLKDSWRWATKHKESILRVIMKKDKGSVKEKDMADATALRAETEAILNADITGKPSGSPEKKKAWAGEQGNSASSKPNNTQEAKLPSTAATPPSARPGKLDVATGLWDYGASSTDAVAKPQRPSVRALFTAEFRARNPNVPVPRETSPMSVNCEQMCAAKSAPPKLTIDTANMLPNKPPPVEQKPINVHALPWVEEKTGGKLLAKDSLTGEVNMGISGAPLALPFHGGPSNSAAPATNEEPNCRPPTRGRERERQQIPLAGEESINSPTSEWAARGLVDAMLKRAKQSMNPMSNAGRAAGGEGENEGPPGEYDADVDDAGDVYTDADEEAEEIVQMEGGGQEMFSGGHHPQGSDAGKENDPPMSPVEGGGDAMFHRHAWKTPGEMAGGAGGTGCAVPVEKSVEVDEERFAAAAAGSTGERAPMGVSVVGGRAQMCGGAGSGGYVGEFRSQAYGGAATGGSGDEDGVEAGIRNMR